MAISSLLVTLALVVKSIHASPTNSSAVPLATVLNGTYAGLYLPTFNQDVFLGMPYAQDTGGPNRFRIPQAVNEKWDGIRDAKNYSMACPDISPEDWVYGVGEDCLSINVVRPAGVDLKEGERLPVAVWIHGGSYQTGTSSLQNHNLSYIVDRSVEIGKPILATSINYRKGGWGMMYSREIQGSGNTNLSLRDMRKALAWISENIHAFGGNSSQVTIWGESAGSFAIGQLLMTYGGRSDNLFHGFIQESGSAATAWYNGSDWYQPIYDKIVNQVDCTDAIDTLECLRTVPYEDLYPFMNSSTVAGPGFYPTVDGDIIPNYPTILLAENRFAHIPHLYGTNSDEGTANAPSDNIINTDDDLRWYLRTQTGFNFPNSTIETLLTLYPDDPALGIPLNTGPERFAAHGAQYKRIAAILGDVFYHAPRLADARAYSASGDRTYIYRFNTRPFSGTTPAWQGVAHFSEVAFVFNNPTDIGPFLGGYEALGKTMSALWISFIRAGDPNGVGLPLWPEYGYGYGNGDGSGKGKDLVLQTEAQGGCVVEEDVWRLEGREFLSRWARRRHV
ncbi:Hypothetical predicted protein [Lecanosticta acicola]|uniref:Carboxylic ester hydrolase n=1 Tax=Lecanosticta acicola TaxID=111012 RepID=A0AAI9ECF8_9PEZI|nr:Hypothetical predicted protein [Lecanosticta acicola]